MPARNGGSVVFKNGFVEAMDPTLMLPIVVVLLSTMSCLAIKRRKHKQEVGWPNEEEAACYGISLAVPIQRVARSGRTGRRFINKMG
jgi:hypothetical protein